MSNDGTTRHEGDNASVPAHASPYPISRLAPVHELVDVAQRIAEADQVIGTVVNAKLQVIAEQIRFLQAQAREIMEQAATAADLHRAECRFRRQVGSVYHLYRRPDGSLYFSLLSPEDWRGAPPHAHEGGYRLEADMSWTPTEQAPGPSPAELRALVRP